MFLNNFYIDFQLVTHFPIWRYYLRWCYKQTIIDSQKAKLKSIHERIRPTCLLCGASGEITAEEFIKFTLKQNLNSNINIIDIGEQQVKKILEIVLKKYTDHKITVKKVNALNLSFIQNNSVDWIDTDGFLGFFNYDELIGLFKEWKRILKDDGYITFREIIRESLFTSIADSVRNFLSKNYMKIVLNKHTLKEFNGIVNQTGFTYYKEKSIIPGFQRYCLFLKKL